MLHDSAHEHAAGRWLATGGSGYQADTVVPRVWTMYFAERWGIGKPCLRPGSVTPTRSRSRSPVVAR